jgi:hypothetical protein
MSRRLHVSAGAQTYLFQYETDCLSQVQVNAAGENKRTKDAPKKPAAGHRLPNVTYLHWICSPSDHYSNVTKKEKIEKLKIRQRDTTKGEPDPE